VGTRARAAGLAPLDREAVALVVEESARLAGDGERLSAATRRLDDLLAEADHHARLRGAATISAADVAGARDAAVARASRLRERLLEETTRGAILVDTSGTRVGQVNGLSVLQLGDAVFGRPARITARVSVGHGQVIDIEREVALGGPLHSKGVLILAGFLAARFAVDEPLSLAATLVFEQSYGAVEGDSASSAELYALLSALGELPVSQHFAVTGSVNQHGDVQAIGGVNEKIEGFFDLCEARGLDGRQGVIVPAANVPHLMLREEVVAAVRAGRFAVHAVRTVDEGMALLTGVPAGEPDARGVWPEGTVNRQVADRLRAFAESRRRFVPVAGAR
jgi:predicted ATP-dependent protease